MKKLMVTLLLASILLTDAGKFFCINDYVIRVREDFGKPIIDR